MQLQIRIETPDGLHATAPAMRPIRLGYKFTPNVFAELGTALGAFEHDVSLEGPGKVASVKHRPTILGINYQFLSESKVRPFVRLVYSGGVDFFVGKNVFLRADVSKLDFDTDVSVETIGDV